MPLRCFWSTAEHYTTMEGRIGRNVLCDLDYIRSKYVLNSVATFF